MIMLSLFLSATIPPHESLHRRANERYVPSLFHRTIQQPCKLPTGRFENECAKILDDCLFVYCFVVVIYWN